MTQPVVITWEPAVGNQGTIASLQSLTAAGNLVLNSNQRNSDVSVAGPYVHNSVIRTVSFTSANNLSARSIIITGIGSAVDGSGNPTGSFVTTSETLAGPNANTVYSAKIYKQITSIAINGAVTNISAGFGSTGITAYVFNDYNRTAWYASCQMQVVNRATLTYTVNQSLTRPEIPNQFGSIDLWPVMIPGFPVATAMTDATTNQIAQLPFPVTIVWATISANTTATETAYFTILQQGTCS